MGEDLQPEELAGLEVEANFAAEGKGEIGKNFVLLEPQFALRWIREHRRLQKFKKDNEESRPSPMAKARLEDEERWKGGENHAEVG